MSGFQNVGSPAASLVDSLFSTRTRSPPKLYARSSGFTTSKAHRRAKWLAQSSPRGQRLLGLLVQGLDGAARVSAGLLVRVDDGGEAQATAIADGGEHVKHHRGLARLVEVQPGADPVYSRLTCGRESSSLIDSRSAASPAKAA